jgi:DNA-directed RNA polymerase delta subunit
MSATLYVVLLTAGLNQAVNYQKFMQLGNDIWDLRASFIRLQHYLDQQAPKWEREKRHTKQLSELAKELGVQSRISAAEKDPVKKKQATAKVIALINEMNELQEKHDKENGKKPLPKEEKK